MPCSSNSRFIFTENSELPFDTSTMWYSISLFEDSAMLRATLSATPNFKVTYHMKDS